MFGSLVTTVVCPAFALRVSFNGKADLELAATLLCTNKISARHNADWLSTARPPCYASSRPQASITSDPQKRPQQNSLPFFTTSA
jgi:hypothetical protein